MAFGIEVDVRTTQEGSVLKLSDSATVHGEKTKNEKTSELAVKSYKYSPMANTVVLAKTSLPVIDSNLLLCPII